MTTPPSQPSPPPHAPHPDAPSGRAPAEKSDPVEEIEAALRRRRAWRERMARFWWRGPQDLPYRALCVAWAVAVAARCTLSNIAGGGWWAAQALLITGTALLLWRGGRVAWLLCAVGLLLPLLLLRDWMTQSTLMLLIALVGLARVHGDGREVRRTAVLLTGLAYLAAAFHKLNRDFLDPARSCAIYGMDKLDRLLPNLPLSPPPELLPTVAPLVIGTELLLALLVFTRRARAALLLGIAFHVPLTIALAPAFAFVMGIGLMALFREAELRALAASLHRWWKLLLASALAMLVAVAIAANVLPIWHTQLKLALFWVLFWATLLARWPVRPATTRARSRRPLRPHSPLDARRRLAGYLLPAAACAWFVMSAALPYVGTRVQHGGAMLANLRIDEDCWNHLLVPESVRRMDPYVRIDHAEMGVPRARAIDLFAHREESLMRGLWAPEALPRMQRNWCNERTRPLVIEGTWRGTAFRIDDLCDPAAELPPRVGIWGGRAWFPGHLRYQVNLRRSCEQACVH